MSERSALPQKTLDISQKISDVSPKTWEIFQKTLDFFQKTSEFFSTPRRKEANGQETMDSHIYKASAINKQESSFLLAYKKLHFQFF